MTILIFSHTRSLPGRRLTPETQHSRGQRLGTVFGKEQSAVRHIDHASRARYGLFEPIGPFAVEEEILEAPDNQGWNGKALQLRVNGDRLRVVEGKPITLERFDALLRREQRLQIESDDLVREDARVGVAAEQRHRLALGATLARAGGMIEQRTQV